jgi:hypothetical protein
VRAREAARVARQQEDERRAAEAAAERGAEAARRTEEAAAEERRQQAWNEARERAEELARREVEEKDAARREIRAIRQPGPTEDSAEEARFGRVHVGLRGGVAGVTVAGVDGDGTATAVLASYGAELDAFLPLKAPHVALKLGASYTNLPVSGCSWAQTRSHTVSGHIGPRFAAPIKGRTWFAVDVDLHVGGGFGAATQADLDGCAEARSAGDPARYVTTIETEHGTARLGLGELGWRWATFALGPGLDAGILASPGERAPWLGLSFYLRHDQVFAVLPGGDLWFRPEGEGSLTLVKTTVDSLDARTAMARFQFGLRGQIQF